MMEDQVQQSVGVSTTYVNVVPTSQSYLYPENQRYAPSQPQHPAAAETSGGSIHPHNPYTDRAPVMDSGGSQLPPYERYESQGAVGGAVAGASARPSNYSSNNNNHMYAGYPLVDQSALLGAVGGEAMSRSVGGDLGGRGRIHSETGSRASDGSQHSEGGTGGAVSSVSTIPRIYVPRHNPVGVHATDTNPYYAKSPHKQAPPPPQRKTPQQPASQLYLNPRSPGTHPQQHPYAPHYSVPRPLAAGATRQTVNGSKSTLV